MTHAEIYKALAEAVKRRGGEARRLVARGDTGGKLYQHPDCYEAKPFPELLAWLKAWFLADRNRASVLTIAIDGIIDTSSILFAIEDVLRMTDDALAEAMLEAEGR